MKNRKNNYQPGTLYKIKEKAAKKYSWDTSKYRMLVIDSEGAFLAFNKGKNKVLEGTGYIDKDCEIVEEKAPKTLSVPFHKSKFWINLFDVCVYNTNVIIK